MASTAPLRMMLPGKFTPLMRVCAVKGTNSASQTRQIAAAKVVLLLGQHHDGPALRRFVGEDDSCAASARRSAVTRAPE